MAEDKYYCGCGHSAWGMLLLFSVIQVFLTSSLFPGVVEIFDGSVAVRSARTKVETAASAMDNSRSFMTNGTLSTLTASPTAANSAIWESAPVNADLLKLNYQDATLRVQAVYNRYFGFNTVPSFTSVSVQQVVSRVDPNNGSTLAVDVWLVPTTSFMFVNAAGNTVTASATATKLGTVDKTTYQNVSLAVYGTYEKQVSTMLTNSLVRTEAFAGFFFLQWIVGLAFFGLALRHYHLQTFSGIFQILSVVGLVLIFLGWVVGWFYNSPWSLNTLFSTYLTTSGTTFTEYAATPYTGLLILNWILMLIYSNYVQTFVNNGGKDEPETPAYQERPMNSTFTNTFKNFTGRITGSSAGNARTTTNAGGEPEGKVEAAALQ